MIFGRTDAERDRIEQVLYRRLIMGIRRFRVVARLADGRWAFFQHVWEYADGGQYSDGKLFLWSGSSDSDDPIIRRYLEPSVDHVRLDKQIKRGPAEPVLAKVWDRVPTSEVASWLSH